MRGLVIVALGAACGPGGREATIGPPVLTEEQSDGATRNPAPTLETGEPETSRRASLEPRREVAADPGPMAPRRYARVVLRLGGTDDEPYRNVRYEGNNIVIRGPRRGGTYAADGSVVAARWRRVARSSAAVFVLRDSLFSQQDHPTAQRPYALMLPPSWVTAAVAAVMEGRAPTPVQAPPIEDDEGWEALETEGELFGSFPPSETLHRHATRHRRGAPPHTQAMIENARASLRSLAADSRAMAAAAPEGAEAVAEVGAEVIASSDVRYFGSDLRRSRVIPIFVENPYEREVATEGKGFEPPGLTTPPAAVVLARNAVLRRRLADGDLAIERYDLSLADERARALDVLESLLPATDGNAGGDLWLWVNGGLDDRGIGGRDATPFIEAFREEVAARPIDGSRVRYLSKPHVILPRGHGRGEALEDAIDRYEERGLPLSLGLSTRGLARLLRHRGAEDG